MFNVASARSEAELQEAYAYVSSIFFPFSSFIWPGKLVEITNVVSVRSEAQMLDENLTLKSMDVEASCTALDVLEDSMENVLTTLQIKLTPGVRKYFYCC